MKSTGISYRQSFINHSRGVRPTETTLCLRAPTALKFCDLQNTTHLTLTGYTDFTIIYWLLEHAIRWPLHLLLWVRIPYLGGGCSKITADGDCSHEIKRCLLLGRKVITNLDTILKSKDIALPTKVHLSQSYGFSIHSCMGVRVGL